jgi:phosphoserine phosphatase
MFSGSCQKDEIVISNTLDRLNWSARNFEVLNQFIKDYGVHGKYYDKNKAPYAVLDWDQTCAHFDVEEALMRYQLSFLKFKLTKEQFGDLLKDNINGVTQLSADYQNVLLADINLDLINDYNFLYGHFSGFNGTMTLEEIKQTPQYNDFIAKLPFLYDGYCDTPGIGPDYGYLWVLYLLAGHTIGELKDLAKEAISFELANKLSEQTWQSPSGFQTYAGVVSYSFHTGLRIFPEMQNLISTFQDNGIEVFIVSASYKPVVEVFSGIGTFEYNLPDKNVIAMELTLDDHGIILPQYKEGWVKPVRQGKVDAINQVIKSGLGKNWDPIFSAGDSDGDYEMLTGFPYMKLALIWNRVKGGDIGKLCMQAVEEMNSVNPRYILQGRNENTGIAMPGPESILFGKTEPQLLYQ